MEKCLWCGKDTEKFFCLGGGPTRARSRTEPTQMTKSYCLDSFLAGMSANSRHTGFTEAEKTFILNKDAIMAWYKDSLMVFEK